MKLSNILNADDRAVSPVIGVILMVAITVILAAVIGTFVLGLGSQVGNNAPQATFEWDYTADGTSSTLTVTHQSGQAIDNSSIEITQDFDSVTIDGKTFNLGSGDSTWQAGDNAELELSNELSSGDSAQIVWQSDSGSSSIISTWEYQG